MDNWRNFVPARSIADELRKFVITTEQAHTSSNVQVRHHGAGLGEVAAALSRLKEQLAHESRYSNELANDFVSANVNGVELLIRVLGILQRHLHETQNQSRLSALLLRNSTNKRRKAGITEADALECLKLLTQKTSAARILLEHTAHVEAIMISVTSPQLDSKCYALELLTLLLDTAGGWMVVMKALTAIAGKSRDDSRLTIIVSQLRHGLNTSKLHIQILVMRLLNKMIAQAPNLNHQVLMQIEAENAGFIAESLERVAGQMGRPADVDVLKREILVYKNKYLPLIWLQRQAKEATQGYPAPNEFPRFTTIPNGDMSTYNGKNGRGWRYDGETTASRTDYSQGDDDSLRERSNRRYQSRDAKYNSNAAVARGIEKQRKRRDVGGRKMNGSIPVDPSEDQGMVPPMQNEDPDLFLERNPSYVPTGFADHPRSNNNSIPRPRTKKSRDLTREESMRSEPHDSSFARRRGSLGEQRESLTRSLSDPPYLRQVRETTTTDEDLENNNSIRAPRRRQRSRDTMKRARSENTLLMNDANRNWNDDSVNRQEIRRRPSQANPRVDYSRNGKAMTLERDNRNSHYSRERPPIQHTVYNSNSYDPRMQGRSQSLHDLNRAGKSDESADERDRRFERMIPVRRESDINGTSRHRDRYHIESQRDNRDMRDMRPIEERNTLPTAVPIDPSPYPQQHPIQAYTNGMHPPYTNGIQPAYTNGNHIPNGSIQPSYRSATPTQTSYQTAESLYQVNGQSTPVKVRRSQSDAAEKIRMQGFSYLFPTQPVLENIPVRRSKTPGPMDELAMRHSQHPAPSPDLYPRPPSAPIFDSSKSSSATMETRRMSPPPFLPNDAGAGPNPVDVPEGHVVYIPVRVEGTEKVANVRPSKSIMKTPYTPPSSTSTPSSSATPIPGGYKYAYSTYDPDGVKRNVSGYTTTSIDRRKGDGYRPNSPKKVNNARFAAAPSESYTDDVEDALRKFDYLNEYEGSSSRGSRYGAA